MVVFKSLLLNIGLLVIIAQILARLKSVKGFILRDKHTVKDNVFMVLIFSMLSILSNYIGYGSHGAIANTRVIGVMAGGFIGGPIVALLVAIIAGIHRYTMDINGFASFACAISTIIEGVLAAKLSKRIKASKYEESHLFIITFVAELIQMLVILIVAKPFSVSVTVVKSVVVPMLIFNPLGMVLFLSVFKNIIIEQEHEIGKNIRLAFDITERCLPFLKSDLFNEENCRIIGDTIQEFSNELAIIFTDTEKILSVSGKLYIPCKDSCRLPEVAERVLIEKQIIFAEDAKDGDVLHKILKNMAAFGAPLIKNNETFGTIIILTPEYKISYEPIKQFADGLSKLLSTQYQLSNIDKQRELLQKAEYHALQSQINPHFLFNAINTISSLCREQPEKARELLIALATYFRNSLQTGDEFISIYDEIENVEAYLQIVKARFEDRLDINITIPDNLEYTLPSLILQPIVENAVIHGALKRKQGIVSISAKDLGNSVMISVSDNGFGIPEEILERLEKNTIESTNVGLSNVYKRLLYIYGRDCFKIHTSSLGTTISICIPKDD